MDLSSARTHDNGNLSITENGEFLSFLEKPISPLRESDLPVCCVLNPLDLDLSSSHIHQPTMVTAFCFQ